MASILPEPVAPIFHLDRRIALKQDQSLGERPGVERVGALGFNVKSPVNRLIAPEWPPASGRSKAPGTRLIGLASSGVLSPRGDSSTTQVRGAGIVIVKPEQSMRDEGHRTHDLPDAPLRKILTGTCGAINSAAETLIYRYRPKLIIISYYLYILRV